MNHSGVHEAAPRTEDVRIQTGDAVLDGSLNIPETARGIVLFAHGSGSSRNSPRNRFVAGELSNAGIGTLLFDLLTPREEEEEMFTGHIRFNIGLLAERLDSATAWVTADSRTYGLPVGYFGASTGAAAALVSASRHPDVVRCIVSRGGRPDLATEDILRKVTAPTLLIVGGNDTPVIGMNRAALGQLGGEKKLVTVPGATHLFEESGALEKVARLATDWFTRHFAAVPER